MHVRMQMMYQKVRGLGYEMQIMPWCDTTSELYKVWNDTSIRPAVWLDEAKLMAAGDNHVWQKHASVVVLYR